MTTYSLLKPQLYQPAGETAAPGTNCVLLGGRCRCGHVYFPAQDYGCENCGAWGEALQPEALSGAGRLMASTRVHRHQGEGRQAPFIIASVQLDAGPVLRTLLDWPATDASPTPGMRVNAVLLPVEDSDENILDLRFRGEAGP